MKNNKIIIVLFLIMVLLVPAITADTETTRTELKKMMDMLDEKIKNMGGAVTTTGAECGKDKWKDYSCQEEPDGYTCTQVKGAPSEGCPENQKCLKKSTDLTKESFCKKTTTGTTEKCKEGNYKGWDCVDLTKFTCTQSKKGLGCPGTSICAIGCTAKPPTAPAKLDPNKILSSIKPGASDGPCSQFYSEFKKGTAEFVALKGKFSSLCKSYIKKNNIQI